MAINVFEGARRIAYLVSGIILVVGLINTYNSSPYETLYYTVRDPLTPAKLVSQGGCESEGRVAYSSGHTPNGHEVSVEICFKPGRFSNGEELVPYKIEGDMIYGDTPYSSLVSSYVDRYKAKFVIPDADGKKVDDKWLGIWLSSKWEPIQNTVLALAGFWIFVLVVGWIVRGFAGIPRGQDHRIDQ